MSVDSALAVASIANGFGWAASSSKTEHRRSTARAFRSPTVSSEGISLRDSRHMVRDGAARHLQQ
jgi:hypothetical protein